MARRAHGVATGLAGIALALLINCFASCSLLVDGDLGDVHCLDEGMIGPPACIDGDVCSGGLCIAMSPEKSNLGLQCSTDSDCGSDEMCFDPSAFGGVGARVCSKTCCSSDECGSSPLVLVCWSAIGGGGRFCREASAVSIAGVGAATAGTACSVDTDCRSGRCVGHYCLDACCSDTSCAAAGGQTACRLESASATTAQESWYCAAPAAAKAEFLATCAVDADCASGLCLEIAGSLRCSMPCCESGTCGTIELEPGMPSSLACAEVLHGSATVRACANVLPATALGAIGTECALDQDCRGGLCLPAPASGGKRICSDACCIDANCMDPTFACRPYGAGSTWALRCEH